MRLSKSLHQNYLAIAFLFTCSFNRCEDSPGIELMFFDPGPNSDDISIIRPNGGEVWTGQDLKQIKWESGILVSESVDVEYSLDDGLTWRVISSSVSNDGSALWNLPALYINTNSCLVKVVDSSNEEIFGVSSNNFTILAASSSSLINIISPNGGEDWHEQSTHTISWTVSGDIGSDYVSIQYSSDNGINWSTVTSSTLNNGLYEWLLPNLSETTISSLVKITSLEDSNIYDVSNNYFVVYADTNFIRFESPILTDSITVGSQVEITWTSGGDVGSNVKLYYSLDAGNDWYTISSMESNDGQYLWTVPTIPSSSSTCALKIEDYSNSSYFAVSESFTIGTSVGGSECSAETPSTGTGSVTDPVDGVSVNVGSTTIINWSFSGPGQVNIHLYAENNYVETIQDWAFNDGSLSYIAPSSLPPGDCYHIVIINPYDPSDYLVGTYFSVY